MRNPMARVLIIDDSADLRDVYAHALLSDGHVVSIAEDGERGMALQAEFQAEILVTDIFMPNRDGLETIQDFMTLYPQVKIIVVSGSGRLDNSPYLATAKEMGVRIVLSKPFDIGVLLDAVSKLQASP